MPRKYTRKTLRASYAEEDLKKALSEVKDGAALKSTSKKYGISPRALRRHRDNKVFKPGTVSLGRHRPDLKKEYEDELALKIQAMEKALFGLTTKDVRRLAYDFATKMRITHRFNNESKMAGPDWLTGFLLRHPELAIRKPQATNIARAVGFNKPQVEKFFEAYQGVLTKHHYSPTRVWNMDETGITNVHTPMNIVATKGARKVGKMTSGEKGKTVTVLCATNAAGAYIPPMFIFPRKRMVESLMKNAPTGAIGHCTESGWTDEESFMKWMKHFVSIAKPSLEEKHVIILDGHHSHKTLAAVEYACLHGIELITLPPHCTHKMQPLDKTFFKALKSAYNSSADTWMVAHQGKRISFYDIAEIFAVAYNKSATIEKSVNGFRVCGLWPFNNHIFTDEDFIPSTPTDEYAPRQETAEDDEEQIGEASLNHIVAANIVETDSSRGQSRIAMIEESRQVEEPSAVQTAVRNNGYPTTSSDDPSIPATSRSGEEIFQNKNVSRAKCLLSELCKPVKSISKCKKTRKTERAQVITLSPYKNALKEKERKKKIKTSAVVKRAVKKQNRSSRGADEDSSDNEEWPCLVCGEPFCNSRPREKWIQCVLCQQWAHEECTQGKYYYICQNCDSDDESKN